MGCACSRKRTAGLRPGEVVGYAIVDAGGGCGAPVGDGCCRVFASRESAEDAIAAEHMTSMTVIQVML